MSGLRRTHGPDEITDQYRPGVITTDRYGRARRARAARSAPRPTRGNGHAQQATSAVLVRHSEPPAAWDGLRSAGLAHGQLCPRGDLALASLCCRIRCPMPNLGPALRSPMPNLCPMPIRLVNTTTRCTLPAVGRHGRVDGGARAGRWGEPCAAAWFCSPGEHVWGALLSARARLVAWPESRRQGAALPFVMNQHATARDHEITAQQGPDPSPSPNSP